MEIKAIAHIQSPYPEKFGIPRQSGLAGVISKIIFEPEYRCREAFRGIDGYSHLWLIWEFSRAPRKTWTPLVHPPRLGGNKQMGVFATRSPVRPNPLGLSSVKLEKIEFTDDKGPILHVSGADLADRTPIFDIKPYLPYTDSHPDADSGFAADCVDYRLDVEFPPQLLAQLPKNLQNAAIELLANDPRPAYQNDPARIYGVGFADKNIKFRVENKYLRVIEIEDYAEYKRRV